MRWWRLNNHYLWCCIPKNGQTSIKEQAVESVKDIRKAKGIKIAVIRHPCDRLVSAYFNRGDLSAGKSFSDFICWACESGYAKDGHIKPQYTFLNPYPDELIPFEKMPERFLEMGVELNHRNKSVHKPWPAYFTDKLMAMVEDFYSQDFDLYRRAHERR